MRHHPPAGQPGWVCKSRICLFSTTGWTVRVCYGRIVWPPAFYSGEKHSMSDRPASGSGQNSMLGKQTAGQEVAGDSGAQTVKPQLREPAVAETMKSSSGSSVAGASVANSDQAVAVGTELGYYRLLKNLGEGGMGSVWQALHTKLDKQVAIKVLPAKWNNDAALLTRFEREMKAVGKLEHPHIVRAMDAGEFNGTHYLVMEFNEGLDLSAYVKQRGPQSVTNACEMLRHAAMGLAHAHEAGLIHRDIKPSNLFLTKQGKVKILDLGLARVQGDTSGGGQTLTGFGQALGTPDYMAPEQWENTHAVDGRSDLYALGCTLFYLLAGRAPYSDEKHLSLVGKMKGHTLDPIPDLKAAREVAVADRPKLIFDLISDDLDAIYRRLMAKRPEERFASANELADALIPYGKQGGGATLAVLVKGRGSVAESSPVAPRQDSRTSIDARSGSHPQPTVPLLMTEFESNIPTSAPAEAASPSFFAMMSEDTTHQYDAPASGSSFGQSKTQLDHSLARRAGGGKLKPVWIGGGVAAVVLLVGLSAFFLRGKGGSTEPIEESSDEVVTETKKKPKRREIAKVDLDAKPARLATKEDSEAKETMDSTDANRALAEWVLSLPGSFIGIIGHDKFFTRREDLPPPPYQVAHFVITAADSLSDADFLRVGGVVGLATINIQGIQSRITDQGIANLAEVAPPSLNTFFLHDTPNVSDDAIPQFNRLSHLVALNLESPKITNAGIAKLSLPMLDRHLGLGLKATPAGLKGGSSRLPALNGISFRNVKIPANELPILEEFRLQSLWLEGTGLRNDDLPLLQNLVSLRSLTIKENPEVTDDGTHHLLALKELRHIEFSQVGIGDSTCAKLKTLPELTSLWIRHTRLSDVGIASLCELPKLKELWISGSAAATDAGLEAFAKCQTLEGLVIDQCPKLTVAGVRKLQMALPNCKITSDFPNLTTPPPANETTPDSKPMPKEVASVTTTHPVSEVVLAPKELRLDEGNSVRPPFKEPMKPGDPLGEFAAVARPARVPGLLSWSVEPLMNRGIVGSVALSSNGIIATGSWDCTIRLWTKDWHLIRILPGHANDVVSVAFSPKGDRLASVSPSPRDFVSMWDVASGQLLWARPQRNWNGRLSWSPDGSRLAVCEPSKLVLLDPAKGSVISEFVTSEYLFEASWSSDGNRIALTRDRSAKVRIVDPAKMNVIAEFENSGADTDAAWSSDSRWLAVSDQYAVGIYDARTISQGQTTGRKQQLRSGARGIEFSPDSTLLATAHDDGTRLFRTSDWTELWHVQGNSPDVHWSKDGKWLVSGVQVLNVSDGKPVAVMPARLPRTIVGPSQDGSKVATAGYHLRIWNGDDGSLITDLGPVRPATQQLLFNAAATKLLRVGVIDDNGAFAAEILDPQNGESLHALTGHSGQTWRAAWSKLGDKVATVGEDGQCILWDAASGSRIRSLKQSEPQWWVQWSSDGSRLATGSETAIIVWRADSNEPIRSFRTLSQTLPRPNGSNSNDAPFSFMKDGSQLITLGKDGNFDSLDVKSGQIKPLGVLTAEGSGGGIRGTATWSPDFRMLISATGYRELEFFPTGSTQGKAIRFFVQPHWLADSRRIIGGDNYAGFVMGVDLRAVKRLGVLLPELPGGEYAAIGPDGNYKGSENCARQVGVVALHTNGSLKTYSLDEFRSILGKKNDPAKVGFLKVKAF